MPLICVCSPKGGVGKTTLAANLAYSLARTGSKVLALDFDVQNALRLHFGVPLNDERGYVAKALEMHDWSQCVLSAGSNIFVLPYGEVSEAQDAEHQRDADRAHRIGQTQDVNVYQIVAKDTIEERILNLQRSKTDLAQRFVDSASSATGRSMAALTKDDLLEVVRAHAEDGVDFMTIHCGINKSVIKTFKETGRLMNIVSRGGSLLFGWMEVTGNENPFYEFYDELLEICHEYDVTISLGDSCRPGCLYDSNDATETAEMIELGKLCKRAWAAGVQVMVEGPGHMALDEIAANMKLQKRLCHNAPFYVLGPLVTDIGVGYDHITAAIGGAISASSGADFLCYVTPAEHLCLPNAQDVLDGLMATKIAAHAADIAKKVPHARDMDDKMGQARRKLDWDAMWKCALDPVTGKKRYEESPAATEGTCTMCGKMCAVRTVNKVFEGTTIDLGMEN